MAGQECGKDQAELWYGGTFAFPSEHKTKLVRNRSVPFRSVPFRSVPSPSEHGPTHSLKHKKLGSLLHYELESQFFC